MTGVNSKFHYGITNRPKEQCIYSGWMGPWNIVKCPQGVVHMKDQATTLFERLSSARVPDSLIDDAIEITVESFDDGQRDEIAAMLDDDEHRRVLRKEVVDVVILTTGAMEAPTCEAYLDLIAHLQPQPYDEATAQLKSALMRQLAHTALEDLDDETSNRDQVVDLLRQGLAACGDLGEFTLATVKVGQAA